MIASLAVAAALIGALVSMGTPKGGPPPLELLCAAVFRPAMERIADDYELEHGVGINVQYAGSGTLLGSIELSGRGDLYMPADQSFLDTARSKGLVSDRTPVIALTPVLGVPEGNPDSITSLEDLTRAGLRLGLADPNAASIGRISRRALRDAGLWDRIQPGLKVFKPTVSEIATDLILGAIDATILWDQTAASIDSIEGVHVAELDQYRSVAAIGLLSSSHNESEARRFTAFVAEQGLERFRELGYSIPERDTP